MQIIQMKKDCKIPQPRKNCPFYSQRFPRCIVHPLIFLKEEKKKKRALSSLKAATESHTQWDLSGGKLNTTPPILPQDSWAFYVDSFPLDAQFMHFYSTGQVTFRLWHLFLFRYQAWFLSNQPAPLPLTSSIREPAYDTSRTGQTKINLGQISAWGNFNESNKNVEQEQCRRILFQAVLPCTRRRKSSSQF